MLNILFYSVYDHLSLKYNYKAKNDHNRVGKKIKM